MLTLEKLEEMGINTKEGLNRCMDNEAFYFKMIALGISNECFESLGKALSSGNLDEAFEAAHALKGVIGNLAIAPIYDPLVKITEMLRAKKDADYMPMYNQIKDMRDRLLAACKD